MRTNRTKINVGVCLGCDSKSNNHTCNNKFTKKRTNLDIFFLRKNPNFKFTKLVKFTGLKYGSLTNIEDGTQNWENVEENRWKIEVCEPMAFSVREWG